MFHSLQANCHQCFLFVLSSHSFGYAVSCNWILNGLQFVLLLHKGTSGCLLVVCVCVCVWCVCVCAYECGVCVCVWCLCVCVWVCVWVWCVCVWFVCVWCVRVSVCVCGVCVWVWFVCVYVSHCMWFSNLKTRRSRSDLGCSDSGERKCYIWMEAPTITIE